VHVARPGAAATVGDTRISTEQLRGSRVRYAKTLIFLFIPSTQ